MRAEIFGGLLSENERSRWGVHFRICKAPRFQFPRTQCVHLTGDSRDLVSESPVAWIVLCPAFIDLQKVTKNKCVGGKFDGSVAYSFLCCKS